MGNGDYRKKFLVTCDVLMAGFARLADGWGEYEEHQNITTTIALDSGTIPHRNHDGSDDLSAVVEKIS